MYYYAMSDGGDDVSCIILTSSKHDPPVSNLSRICRCISLYKPRDGA